MSAGGIMRRLFRQIFTVCLVSSAVLGLITPDAQARAGKGGSFGSRGSHTYSAPPSTQTAPRAAQPMERSTTPSQPSAAQSGMGQRAPMNTPQPSFARNMMMGVGAGLLGAGLFGMLSGSGFFSGLGSLAGFFGLLLQAGLIFLLVRFALSYFRRRNAPAMAGMPRQASDEAQRSSRGGLGGFGAGLGRGTSAKTARPVSITPQDFSAFEKALYAVQEAYSLENTSALSALVTPEMLTYFKEEFASNAQNNVRNDISGVKLLQGDVSESWSERELDYATLAMRFSLTDTMLHRQTGAVVEGGTANEATELWTFVRGQGHDWTLSALQQVSAS